MRLKAVVPSLYDLTCWWYFKHNHMYIITIKVSVLLEEFITFDGSRALVAYPCLTTTLKFKKDNELH